ncbi:class I adenylate-forming enzyme family protein [Pseudorhodoferax sp. Leaf267]|uniref:class I adenylate-forming enzyme family protein n=1 Tax=Pseudorhodoferax sp. Leaf267 TaxID=1736316 RepID=UPI0006FA3D7D|nr:long-chain fatty acid--CoA ligase [Pseudorhodoferax sp. Leaf267]KQP22446.1 AMP-dependent synthetase [Pseudorhodoferax sp. Leaf267]
MYLTQGLHRAVQRHPHKTALRHLGADGQRALTFAELQATVARHAAALQARGVQAGDRVALLAPNNDQLIVLLWACWWLGAVASPLNTRWSLAELRHALADSGARLLVADAELAGALPGLDALLPTLHCDALAAEAAALAPLPDSRTGGDALAALLYTGGTTGRSKGVMLSHANFWAASMTRAAELPNDPNGVSLLVAPLFHVAGLGRLVGQSLVGGACITMPNFRPDLVASAIAQHGITDTIMVPSMLQALLDMPGFDATRVQSLNRIAFGAAPMPPDLLDRALQTWPQAEFFQAYGMTETAGAACINPPANHRGAARDSDRWRSVGRPGLGAEIRVVDESGHELPRGTVGEIVIRGPMVTSGYWNLPEATAQAMQGGWLRTGDGARMDEEGYLFIADRLKDMIISGGENVYSAEVEAALRSHPAVMDAAVIGVPDARWGEAVHAVIVVRPGAAAAEPLDTELKAWCRQSLAGYKIPRSISFTPALPMSAAGKVLKTTLRAAHAA